MEALKHLINNVPDWLKKLDELNGQIEQRQIELARLTEENNKTNSPDGPSSSGGPKSVRNRGSTESLRPRDEPAAHPADSRPQPGAGEAAGTPAAANDGNEQPAPSSPSESQSPSEIQRQTSQVRAAGQARARAMLRKRQRTDSVISAEGATPKYRSRSMIIVYYDSYVQLFFEELVKFVSGGRNMMRKAKMAAKVAQIKRLAELETPDEQDDAPSTTTTTTTTTAAAVPPLPTTTTTTATGIIEVDNPITPAPAEPAPSSQPIEAAEENKPAMHYVSTRRMGAGPGGRAMRANMYGRVGAGGRVMRAGAGPAPMLGADGKDAAPDVYDELDKGLEYVQSMCEHAAHQFLRDGECGEEVANIKRRLAETKELADKEMERIRREEPEALLKHGENDATHGRSYRPQSMRKAAGKPSSSAAGAGPEAGAAPSLAPAPVLVPAEPTGPLEVDEGVDDVDKEEAPKLVWRSTRMMR
ncbi:hypothetical protein MYCTH_2309943 [Thermothelomyces thermophilus ATCC 42464]|uniref:Uncharacterized protein n=1 Tax=Thermothelomyces thermophilus (strain ATCC 42464 / BCRC 31852 / DSM 1799) TaxID=573729 RepID=G2QKW4_THET4|nr:uncharacterized protein MYCTH_2309943 [Thermothelomyces thermophilus ATCC 42464]AEO60596.1 hypothetical protein MYCTH_2309943 [Thermothelomyces thermophilus ATCC 42464]